MIPGKDYIGIGVWGLVFNENQELLLIQRNNRNKRERPGGKVEIGETLENAIIREIKEETNIDITIDRFLNREEIFIDEIGHRIIFCYICTAQNNDLRNNEPKKHKDIGWFPLEKLPKKLTNHTIKALNQYKNLITSKN